ncbi:Uncharacterized protein OBRU01_20087 [Operophtera brumata]|uniref:Uncharacterized protein n=1 Tax=Operophtera brumata TaxID=104452 RepID=A0A0L7KVP5_OPEBR|nr:Uncharacterized protein OBRU01_20087 [Operophtera brumata]
MPGMPQLRPYNAPLQPFPYGGMYYPPGVPAYNPYYPQQYQQAQGSFSRAGRSTRDAPPRDPGMEALEEMEVYLYDYLSGGGAFDFDLYI